MDIHLKRIPIAALIAALVGVGLGGIGAMAEGNEADEPFLFAVPAVASGDAWSYAIKVTSDDLHHALNLTAAYRWEDPVEWVDGEGLAHAVVPLTETLQVEERSPQVRRHLIDQASGSSIATVRDTNATGLEYVQGVGTLGALELRRERWAERASTVTTIGAGAPPCGHLSDLQGTQRILPATVVLRGACLPSLLAEQMPWDEAGLHATPAIIGDRAAAVLRATDGHLEAALVDNIPYPVSIRAGMEMEASLLEPFAFASSQDEHIPIEIHWRLVAFTPGTAEWQGAIHLPPPQPMRPIELAPRQVWGPVDEGVDHPFRLSVAFQHARDAPAYPDLREFLASHPDAAVVNADYWKYRDVDLGTIERTWVIMLSDGDAAHGTIARQFSGRQDTASGALFGNAPNEVFQAFPVGARALPDPADLPDQLPTVASMFDRYQGLHGEPADAWMVNGWCRECNVELTVAGQSSEGGIGSPPTAYDHRHEARQGLRFSTVGQVVAMFHDEASTSWRAYVEDGSGPASSPPDPVDPTVGLSDLEVVPVEQEGPFVSAAASLGAFGVIAGVAYWSWPWIKSVPLSGLFSRVHGHKLLEHPVRAQIMASVREHPGIHYQALVDRIGRGRGAAEHHLKKLEDSGLVSTVRGGGYTCYYARGEVKRDVMEAMPAVKAHTASKILAAVAAAPGITATQLCTKDDLLPSTVSYHLKRMRAAGLVEASRRRNGGLRATPLAFQIIESERPPASAAARAPRSVRPSPGPARSARRRLASP